MEIRRENLMKGWVWVLAAALVWSCGDGGGDEDGEQAAQTDSTTTDSTAVDSAASDTAAKKIEAVPVEVALAHTGSISSSLLFNSTIETEEAVEIYPQISGLVERAGVEEGDRVEAADTLLYIEDKQLRIAAREAQVNYAYQQTGYERTEEMFKRKLISDQEYETRRFELEQSNLRLARAQLELENAAVLAPFSGVITERAVQVGARVGPSSKLYDLIKLDDMIARVYVPGQYLINVVGDQRAMITSEFLPDKRFSGWVKRISPVVDPRSGTFKVTVGLRDRFEFLRPGLFVNVQIITDTHEQAVLIPKQAVVYDGGEKFVFAVDDTAAVRVELKAGFENADYIESMAQIEPGDQIIIVGQNGLKDKARVRVVNVEPVLESSAEPNGADEG